MSHICYIDYDNLDLKKIKNKYTKFIEKYNNPINKDKMTIASFIYYIN